MKSILISLRDVPGFVTHAGSGFRYIESKSIDAFDTYFRHLSTCDFKNVPSEGGMVDERVEVQLPTGESFFCISYRGDLEGWRSKIENHARISAARYGRVEGQSLVLSDGSRHELAACQIVQH